MMKPLNGTIVNINTIGVEKPVTWVDVFNNVETLINSLPTITYVSDGTGYGYIDDGIDESGKYVKLEDVLNLFGAKKKGAKPRPLHKGPGCQAEQRACERPGTPSRRGSIP